MSHDRRLHAAVSGALLLLAIPLLARADCPTGQPFNALFSPESTVTQVDSVVTVALGVDSTGTNFNGYTVSITYDPSIVELESVVPGPLMANDCGTPFEDLVTSPGNITYTCIILCAGVSIDGPGNLCVLSFRALELGQSLLQITSNRNCTFFDAGICVGEGHPSCPRPVVFHDGSILVTDGVTAAPDATSSPSIPRLALAPNPTTRGGVFSFQLGGSGTVRLELFDAVGRRVLDRSLPGGEGSTAWDGRDSAGSPLGSGRYVARVSQGPHRVTTSVVVLR